MGDNSPFTLVVTIRLSLGVMTIRLSFEVVTIRLSLVVVTIRLSLGVMTISLSLYNCDPSVTGAIGMVWLKADCVFSSSFFFFFFFFFNLAIHQMDDTRRKQTTLRPALAVCPPQDRKPPTDQSGSGCGLARQT